MAKCNEMNVQYCLHIYVCIYNVYITYKNEMIEVENNVVSLFTFWMRSSLVQSKNFICNKTDNFEVCIK